MNKCGIAFALLFVAGASVASAAPANRAVFSDSTLERALETGCSLVIAEVLSVRSENRMYYYRVRVARTIVAGDLDKEEVQRPLELFAGASYGEALETGRHYVLLVARDCPYAFSWAFRDDVIEVDPSDEAVVRRLTETADRVYAKTSILQFRRVWVEYNVELPPLPEELASLCEAFRQRPGWRTDIGRKIFESDLGSRIDASDPASSIRKYLPPKISCSRSQIFTLLGHPTWKNGWTYFWCCDYHTRAQGGGEQIAVLSATFDPNERAVRVLYDMYDRSKWIKRPTIAERLAEQEGDPAGVARRFREALHASDWDQALSLCSQRVKAKAGEFGSAEDFFKRFVPVEQIVALPGFSPRGFSSRGGRTVRMSTRVGIDVPEAGWPVEWGWTLVKTGQAWLIDLEPTTLETFIRKELLRREFMERRPRISSEEFARAIEFHLSPVVSEFVVGRPMLFRVEMSNVGDKPIPYMGSGAVMTNDSMLVTGPDGRPVPYADVSYQIGVAPDVILPGETIVLADRYDVTSQYRIIRAGRYRFQFRGWPRESERSNTCDVNVKPGALSDADRISQSLLSVLPDGWDFERMPSSLADYDEEAGAGQLYINLIGWHGGKGGDKGVFLLILRGGDPTDVDPWLKERYDFWGLTSWGPLYARVNEVEQLWPNYRARIERVLGVEPAE